MGVRVCVGACAYMRARCTSACLPGLPALPSMDMWGGRVVDTCMHGKSFRWGIRCTGCPSLAYISGARTDIRVAGGGGDAHEREQAHNQINETWDGASM